MKTGLMLFATVLCALTASVSFAADGTEGTNGNEKAATKSTPTSKAAIEARRKAAGKVAVIDINNAKKAQLKTLPGIGDAEADKIIAGRPYGSKAWLVSNNIISDGLYAAIKDRIVAKQPFKKGSENAALYKNKP